MSSGMEGKYQSENIPCHKNLLESEAETTILRSELRCTLYTSFVDPLHDKAFMLNGKCEQSRLEPFSNRRRPKHFVRYGIVLILTSFAICETCAFTTPSRLLGLSRPLGTSNFSLRSSTAIHEDEIITAVQPQTKSKTKRKKERRKSSQSQGIILTTDPSMTDQLQSYVDFIETSSSQLFPSDSVEIVVSRPNGRPVNVPGAMSRQTLVERRAPSAAAQSSIKSTHHGSAPITNGFSNLDLIGQTTETTVEKKRGRGRPRKNLGTNEISLVVPLPTSNGRTVDGSLSRSSMIESTNTIPAPSSGVDTHRKRRVKNLPPSRARKERDVESETTGMMESSDDSSNLQKYYRTELLSAHEEYELGMKVQFMVKAQQVHEGLHLQLLEYPTITEWANACGFVLEDDSFPHAEDVSRILPTNAVENQEKDPNMFVGNGLVTNSGPGRGKGRVKEPPPTFMEDVFFDLESEFEDVNGKRVKKKTTPNLQPINRGTPNKFVEMMLEGKDAKQRMVRCNMRLVVSISKRYSHVGVNIADLIQEGSIGLNRAAEKFEPMMGFKFSTYASWWIQQAVFRAIAYHSRTIRLPVHVHNHLNRARRVRQELQHEKGRPPSNEEMAEVLQMTVEKYIKMQRLSRKAISLDIAKYRNNPKDIGQESDTSLGDTIGASDVIVDENTPEQNVNRVLFRDDLKEMLEILGEDERAVIDARYGLTNGLTQTVTTVATKLGQTKAWVRSAECCALRKLRRPWYEKILWQHQNTLSG